LVGMILKVFASGIKFSLPNRRASGILSSPQSYQAGAHGDV
jgi:hypothetical protein